MALTTTPVRSNCAIGRNPSGPVALKAVTPSSMYEALVVDVSPQLTSATSPSRTVCQSPAIAEVLHVGGDRLVEARCLGSLLPELRDEPRHLLIEGLAVLLDHLRAHIPPGREHIPVRAHLVERRALAEARDVVVLPYPRLAAPGVVGVGDAGDVVVGELAVGPVDHRPELASVDEEDLAAAVTEAVVAAAAREEPQAHRYLGRVEELSRQRNHAVHQARLDQVLADLTLTRLAGRHRTVREHEARHARRRQVVNDVLHPGEVGVPRGRDAVLPALVVPQPFAAPVRHVERRVGQDEVGLEVRMLVVVERVAAGDSAFDPSQGEVHVGQAPGGVVGLLPEDRNVRPAVVVALRAVALRVLSEELHGLHEHAGRPAAGVVHPSVVRLDHLHEQLDHRARGVELAALLAFGAGELREEILVDPAEHVPGPRVLVPDRDVADEVDELTEALLVEGLAGVLLGKHVLEHRVRLLDVGHRVVDDPPDLGLTRLRLEAGPARVLRHPEDVDGAVLVEVLRVRPARLLGDELGVLLLERVRDVLEEDQAEDHVLVLAGVHVVAERIGHLPQLGLVADRCAVRARRLRGAAALRHCLPFTPTTRAGRANAAPGPCPRGRPSAIYRSGTSVRPRRCPGMHARLRSAAPYRRLVSAMAPSPLPLAARCTLRLAMPTRELLASQEGNYALDSKLSTKPWTSG